MAGSNDGAVFNSAIVILALGVFIFAIWSFSSTARAQPMRIAEGFDSSYGPAGDIAKPMDPQQQPYKSVDFQANVDAVAPADCFPRDRLSAQDLLPKDSANSKWAQVNPAGQGDVGDQNFLTASYHQGVDTIGATLRNANLQLRSEPPNPRQRVSIWNESTIEPDLNRRPFEIDGSC